MRVGVEGADGMPRIGAHVPSSDGYVEAVEREVAAGGDCGQFSLEDSDQWEVPAVDDREAERFRTALRDHDVEPWIVRGSDRINLATPHRETGLRSLRTVREELRVAGALGAAYYVIDPGDHTGTSREVGVANAVRRLAATDFDGETTILVENTRGEGGLLGTTVEELGEIVERSTTGPEDVGISLDTRSLYAAGYDVTTPDGLASVLDAVESSPGIEYLHALHLTDSGRPLGSHEDGPVPVGDGEIGAEGFATVVNHEWLRRLPMVVEPTDPDRAADAIGRVRGLVEVTPEPVDE